MKKCNKSRAEVKAEAKAEAKAVAKAKALSGQWSVSMALVNGEREWESKTVSSKIV